MIKVLVVDDHPVFRAGVRAALADAGTVTVVGEAADAATALSLVDDLAPDVVLMDLHLPDRSGIDATRRLAASHPEVAVLVLTMSEDADAILSAVRAGARGYLVKGAEVERIQSAVRTVAAGEVVFGEGIADRALALLTGGAGRRTRPDRPFPMLTDREVEILALVAAGLSNTDIARRLVVSEKTVRNHVSNIFTKIQVTSRAEAVARARDAGLAG